MSWTGLVLARSDAQDVEMASRLPSHLHPVAGRPLVWHTASVLANLDPPPDKLIVVAGTDLGEDLFHGILVGLEVIPPGAGIRLRESTDHEGDRVIAVDAAALLDRASLQPLLEAPTGSWIECDGTPAAVVLPPQLVEVAVETSSLAAVRDRQGAAFRLHEAAGVVVRDRVDLARAIVRTRDRIVRSHMDAGVTFLLPETVLVDVDVRIARDTVIYPGVVLEGQTHVGQETVIGPGCRIVDSWIGSGVELKGWNYIAHTSIRNRAILEPYVRRGFD